MSEQAQATRWRFESEFVGLVVYHEGRKIARFAGGVFETDDRHVAAALRGFYAYCHEAPIAPIPIVIHNVEAPAVGPAASKPAKPAKSHN